MVERPLTEDQHDALDRIADDWPVARVIGWHEHSRNAGPLIRGAGMRHYPHGEAYVTRSGSLRELT